MCYSCMYISKNLGKFLRYDISPECHCLYPCAKQLFFCCLPCVLLLLPHAWKALIVIFSFTHERSQVGSVGGALCRGWAGLGAAPASASGAFCLPCLSLSCVCVLIGRVPLPSKQEPLGRLWEAVHSWLGTSRQQLPGVKKCVK